MTCREFEPLIALYADLDAADARRVDDHLTDCGQCRQLLEDLQANQAALRDLASEPVDAELVATVRSRVMTRVGEQRRVVWPWVAGLAAAAALVASLMAPPRKAVEQPRPAPRRVVIAEQTIEPPPVPIPKRMVKRRATKPKQREPLVVKMLTDDPDIVIIWLVDQRGD